jgi:hypothetical protein
MKPWDPLNARQLSILRRIADGTDTVSNADPRLAATVYALRGRGLVTTPRQAGGWHATITEAGRFYLEHGYHPRHPRHAPRSPAMKHPPQEDHHSHRQQSNPERKLLIAPQVLLSMVQAADGSVTIADPAPDVRAAWRRAIYAARASQLPQAAMLMYTGRDRGDLRIWLPASVRSSAEVSASTVPAVRSQDAAVVKVAGRLPAEPHPVVALVRDKPGLVRVTGDTLPRVLVILQAITDQIRRRGYDLIVTTHGTRHGLAIDGDGFRCELRITELNQVRKDDPPAPADSWDRRPQKVPSGRLQIGLGQYGRTWTDGKRSKLEDRLGEVLAELDEKMAVYRARLARREREQAERRQQQEQATADARAAFIHINRRDCLLAQHNAWRLADSLRQFCAAMNLAYSGPDPAPWQRAGKRWTTWLMQYADTIDPTRHPKRLASLTFDPEPSPEDLTPYLDGPL